LFVAVAQTTSTTGAIQTSPDGVNWTARTSTAASGSGWISVCYGNGLFVAVAQTTSTTGAIQTSPDGVNWTARTSTAASGYGWISVCYGNGLFVAVANTTSTTGAIQTSAFGGVKTFILAGAGGRSASIDMFGVSNNYVAWNAGANTTFASTTPDAQDIRTIAISTNNSNIVAFGGLAGALNSFDGFHWKGSDNTGTGIGPTSYYGSAQALLGSNAIYTLAYYGIAPNAALIAAGASGGLNSVSSTNAITALLTIASGGTQQYILSGFTDLSYLYVYRYEAPNPVYMINLVGNSLGKSYIYNSSTFTLYVLKCQYAYPQISNGVTRHIITTAGPQAGPTTAPVLYDGSGEYSVGTIGYTSFTSTFNTTAQYSAALTAINNISSIPTVTGTSNLYRAAGFNYAEVSYKTAAGGANVYELYSPQPVFNPTDFVTTAAQTNTPYFINHYGKLTNSFGVGGVLAPSSGQLFEIRWCVEPNGAGGIPGFQSYLSAAMIYGTSDTLGTLLTNIGEIDSAYCPHIINDNAILYRYNGNFFIVTITTSPTNLIQKINDRLYKINTISPMNLYDDITQTINVSSMDYDGRILVSNTTAATASAFQVDAQILGGFSNSIDVSPGNVLIGTGQISSISSLSTFQPIGINVPYLNSQINYGVLTYYGQGTALNYLSTTKSATPIQQFVDPSVVKPIWISNSTYFPVSIGNTYQYRNFMTTTYSTILLNQNYQNPFTGSYNESDIYNFGSELAGVYQPFNLFAQDYAFDGNYIWALYYDQQGNYSSKVRVANANGLILLAQSPTKIYFITNYDNSIFVFNGSRDLGKILRLNEKPTINSGVFSVHDNCLALDTATSIIWVNDEVITENQKAANQTNLKYFDTTSGLIIANNINQWQYTFLPLAGSLVLPLTFQTAYNGFGKNEKSGVLNYIVTLYSKNRAGTNISGKILTRDETEQKVQNFSKLVTPGDYDALGYYIFRVQPQNKSTLGSSLFLNIPTKNIILEIAVETIDDVQGVMNTSNSL
jgi:hypothetical protein